MVSDQLGWRVNLVFLDHWLMARVISTKSQNIYVKDRPFKKIYDGKCSEDQKAKEGLIPFPSNIQQLMVRDLIFLLLYNNMT